MSNCSLIGDEQCEALHYDESMDNIDTQDLPPKGAVFSCLGTFGDKWEVRVMINEQISKRICVCDYQADAKEIADALVVAAVGL